MIDFRRLRDAEFPKLKQVAEGTVPDPSVTVAVVAEDAGQIVARMFLMAPQHIEGTWIAESHRNSTVAARLLKRMEQEAANAGITNVLAYSLSDEVSDYLSRLGYKRTEAVVFQKELSCR